LYDAFCKATGFGGTPRQGPAPSAAVARSGDSLVVRFDTNVASSLPWSFRAETPKVEAWLGETTTVFFRVRNDGPVPATGVATFNV
ncbi:cytochrome c oxidase assembly protein, partial [Escherichia coli]